MVRKRRAHKTAKNSHRGKMQVTHACNSSTGELKAGGLQVQGLILYFRGLDQPGLEGIVKQKQRKRREKRKERKEEGIVYHCSDKSTKNRQIN